ncbi:hypothetical protein H1230_13360 [Paenibacillus sp. 19GGS1-52]|uniref:phage tail terminator family protein n=1 Tax=Paenibacillus sp. 19GGS1-52 TaxID=2758563 RepID=UPI001EFC01D1|nr:hypothetical protein [Paenibacillus sp. 19GGS1-52]ULO09668.1 hypothetical protein H1230_13360 [Paenibacillus sp. 19GGS1-52]
MITLINVAEAINQKLIDILPDIPIQSSDIREGFGRPCLYVDFDSVVPAKYGPKGLDRTISVIIYFFPTSQTNYKLELLTVQDMLETAFVDNFKIVDGFVVYPSNLSSDKVDGILQVSFDIQLIEIADEENGNTSDFMMDELDVNV